MFSRASRHLLALFALSFPFGCGANGDQVLGTIIHAPSDDPIHTDAGSGVPDALGGCVGAFIYPAHPIADQLDIYFVIDRSGWMLDSAGDKWDAFVSGFTHFLRSGSADGIGIGAGFYPAEGNPDCSHCAPRDCGCLAACGCPCNMQMDPRVCPSRQVCDSSSYARADVDIGQLPQNSSALVVSLGWPAPSPPIIRPALQGGLDFARQHAERNRDDRVDVVLVAGGPPDPGTCSPDSINDCADAAASSNLKTHVVAFDFNTNGPSLEPVAMAGGGKFYDFASHRDDISMRFAGLVADLKNEAHCHYDLPPNTDLGRVNLQVTYASDAGVKLDIVRQVKNRASCGNGAGWYYDRSDHPTRIIACDATCSKIQGASDGSVNITVGCGVPPPP